MKTRLSAILIFLGPALFIMTVFIIIPIALSLLISVTDFNVYAIFDWRNAKFIGFQNFIDLFSDEIFWKALFNTFYALVVALPLTIIFSLLFALLLNRGATYLKSFFRLSLYLPSITNTVAIAVVWAWLLNPRYGLLNWFLGLFGIAGQNWLSDPKWAMPSIIALVVWKAIGPNMLLFLAGLQNIPDFLYEAAELDGANRWKQFLHITVPSLRPQLLFVSVMLVIGYLQLFEEPYMLTKGGPLNSTMSIVLYLYRQGFYQFNFGYASAVAVVLFGIILALTAIQMRLRKYQE